MRVIRALFVFFLLGLAVLGYSPAVAQSSVDEDRQLDEEQLEDFRGQTRFDYLIDTTEKQRSNWLQRLLRWFLNSLGSVFTGQATLGTKIIFYTVTTLIVLFAILRLMGADSLSLFYRKTKSPLEYAVEEENIHEIDFEQAVVDARAKGDYRRAIRLMYLYAIKILADAQAIKFEPGKTNYEYQQELTGYQALQQPFGTLSVLFAYAWYGNFEVAEKDADEAEGQLQPLLKLKKGAAQ